MVEIFKSFEQSALRLSPVILVLPGLVAAALGLFVWLGGLGFRRLLLAVVGALAGAACALAMAGPNPGGMVLLGLLGAFSAVIFQQFFTAALLGLLAGVATFLVVAWPSLAVPQGTLVGHGDASSEESRQSVPESLETVRMYTLDVGDRVRRAGADVIASRWAVVAAAALTFLLIGLLFRYFGTALACAGLGTVMIFLGLILLLMFKGSAPVTRIEARAPFFGLVFAAMVVFGTLEQWILCRRAAKREPDKTEKSRPRKQGGKRSWRGR